ncbi:MAG: IS21 family transposase, partial [Myxococcota bacterium]
MANRRTDMHRLQELVRLHRMSVGAREVARMLSISPNTERRYRLALQAEGLLSGPVDALPALDVLKAAVDGHRPTTKAVPSHEQSSIEYWRPRVEQLVAKGLTPRPIFDRLRQEEEAFEGSYWAVKRLCRRIQEARGVRPEDVAIPVETLPGDVAQVDFGYAGKLMCPQTHVPRRAWVFVITLGYSRHMYAEAVFDQKTATWIALHVRAFKSFGGVPQTIVPDNLKAAVIRAAFEVDVSSELNRSYRELARYYGFKIDPTPPRSPQKKGKVESSVKYVKRNALAGREGEPLDAVNGALAWWVDEIAGTRTHGTT